MGIDVQAIRVLVDLSKKKSLGKVITLGRQNLSLSNFEKKKLSRKYNIKLSLLEEEWAEPLLLEHFKAESIDSVDNSKFEGATIIHDLNTLIDDEYANAYDTVLDFGTSEHIYNIKAVVDNLVKLTKVAGHVVHIVPSNNMCGHGFYQFSPMFYTQIYSRKNGFTLNFLAIAKIKSIDKWYKVVDLAGMDRYVFYNQYPSTIIVIATKETLPSLNLAAIQQPDYATQWITEEKTDVNPSNVRFLKWIKKLLLSNNQVKFVNTLVAIYLVFRPFHGYADYLNRIKNFKSINENDPLL